MQRSTRSISVHREIQEIKRYISMVHREIAEVKAVNLLAHKEVAGI
jgi:hypothetical protein